jgi:hypothetical protein
MWWTMSKDVGGWPGLRIALTLSIALAGRASLLFADAYDQPPGMEPTPPAISAEQQGLPQPTQDAGGHPSAASPEAARAAPSSPKKAAAPPSPYKPLFYDNDFSYLNGPGEFDCYVGDSLKQNVLHECWLLDLGGEYGALYQN